MAKRQVGAENADLRRTAIQRTLNRAQHGAADRLIVMDIIEDYSSSTTA